MSTIEDEIRAFIVETFLFGDESRPVATHDSLIENGFVDSTGILELVAFIEDRFGIKVADDEIVPENLDTVAQAAAFVARKRDGETSAPRAA